MSVNKYNSVTGLLEPVTGSRMWVGTRAEMQAAKTAGTLPTDAIIYVTDDEDEIVVQNEINDIVNVYGAKNLLPTLPATTTVNGITYTLQSDGSVIMTGTTPNDSASFTYLTQNLTLKAGEYIVSSGNAVDTNRQIVIDKLDDTRIATLHQGKSLKFTLSEDTVVKIYLWVNKATSGGSLRVYPMIRAASITDDTYVPYSMTNQQLTNMLNKVIIQTTNDGLVAVQRHGQMLMVHIEKTPAIAAGAQVEIGNVSSLGVNYTDTAPMIIGSTSYYWIPCYLIVQAGKLYLTNNSSTAIPNAWYKGSAVLYIISS